MTTKYDIDPFYKTAFEFFKSDKLMKAAGWLDENQSSEQLALLNNKQWLTTPFHKLNIKEGVRNKVLLTTGSFAPIHCGHINLMEKARDFLTCKKNLQVAGGYISTSHDDYVLYKDSGSVKKCGLYIGQRNIEVNKMIVDKDWLMLDPWEGLYNDRPINFSSVIIRLQQYLRHHISDTIDVIYVYGSDNIDFSHAFIKTGESICVQRPGYNIEKPEWFSRYNRNNHWVENDTHQVSSTQIRKQSSLEEIKNNNEKPLYLLRDDIKQSVDFDIDSHMIDIFKNILSNSLDKQLISMAVEDQLKYIQKYDIHKTISLDMYYKADFNINICRLFDLSGYQASPLDYYERNGLSLSEQLNNIKPGIYQLIDDDIASGSTLNMILKWAEYNNVILEECFFLNNVYMNNNKISPSDVLDIVDMRDFILGAKMGGLCVNLPNGLLARVMYTLPYVNLTTRMHMPEKNQVEFSYQLWNWNKKLYSKYCKKVKDLCPLTQNWLKYIGFRDDDDVANVCQWHIDRLETIR